VFFFFFFEIRTVIIKNKNKKGAERYKNMLARLSL